MLPLCARDPFLVHRIIASVHLETRICENETLKIRMNLLQVIMRPMARSFLHRCCDEAVNGRNDETVRCETGGKSLVVVVIINF